MLTLVLNISLTSEWHEHIDWKRTACSSLIKIVHRFPSTLCRTLASVWLDLAVGSRLSLHNVRTTRMQNRCSKWNRKKTKQNSCHYFRKRSISNVNIFDYIYVNNLKNVHPKYGRFLLKYPVYNIAQNLILYEFSISPHVGNSLVSINICNSFHK